MLGAHVGFEAAVADIPADLRGKQPSGLPYSPWQLVEHLIDEYQAMVHPVLVGGGIPYFPQRERRVDLELVETRTFSSRVVYLRYRVPR